MAVVPIEVVKIGEVFPDAVDSALALANSVQKEFQFIDFVDPQSESLQMHTYNHAQAPDFLNTLESFRNTIRGYHPFIIAIIDATLDGKQYGNIFGSHRDEAGLAVITVANVSGIIPPDRMAAYFLYYFARYALSFISPTHRNHVDSRSCVFDSKVEKKDLLKSMRNRALCDSCRSGLVDNPGAMTTQQFKALDLIFTCSGRILNDGNNNNVKPRVFIGSSTEGLKIAYKIQELLTYDVTGVVWNQGKVFKLGDATLEALEAAVVDCHFGIFVFTPDDQLQTRGETIPVARDNVLFELGLFIGKLGRHKAYAINPGKRAVSLPSDLLGITTATYDPDEEDLAAALGPVCNQIREAINKQNNS